MQHKGDLLVTEHQKTSGQITGTTYVRSGGFLITHGQLAERLIIDEGGHAIVHGQVSRNVINDGTLELWVKYLEGLSEIHLSMR